jgi:Dyp-type peroxidase family
MEKIEWDDVQRLVLSGYKKLRCSAYLLWRFNSENGEARKQWLAALSGRLRRASAEHGEADEMPAALHDKAKAPMEGRRHAINLALTASGMKRLGVEKAVLDNFSSEFLEGMSPRPSDGETTSRRSNILGDLADSSPKYWDWGGWGENSDFDGLLLLFAEDEPSRQDLIDAEKRAMAGVADLIPVELRGYRDPKNREHFGYVDGLSQPIIEGRPQGKHRKHIGEMQERISLVKPGEFLLGYPNERRTRVGPDPNANGSSPGAARDLRRNGTYLVFRQLEQHVDAFEEFVSTLADDMRETEDWVRGRLLGRLPDGRPLIEDSSDPHGTDNTFLYYYQDRLGLTCPIGAHIRRANPRDSLGPDPDTALRLSKMHRIIRRGRPYGKKRDAGSVTEGADGGRGLMFIALNADIAGQFEMIQHSWLNNPRFEGLYNGTDPFSHFIDDGRIVIQSRPTNVHTSRPRPFVKVRGGGYFFLPGIQALRSMAA